MPCDKRIVIVHRRVTFADTRNAVRTLETSHSPTYYLPPADVLMSALHPTEEASFCEWKGYVGYFNVVVDGQLSTKAASTHPTPTADFEALRDHIVFYADPFDACPVGDDQVTLQPGGFYAGWITTDLSGPFKGVPGSHFW